MKPHKHAELIKAWADGAVIQYYSGVAWTDVPYNEPQWDTATYYRVKLEEKPLQTHYVKKTISVVKTLGNTTHVDVLTNFSEQDIQITYNPNTKAIEDITWRGKAF